ncbi:disintegrin and metalloproteinase domain-containing protein 10-like isoform X4 [Centruroides sculpturatus]|uniref:disintegrin and metalloproteinase domain-containing protein 10-like isoform X3 n=1 Tax=Centruroides sculpturatus TaxID=218467 RepID=UPI000C6EE5D4|nr:disintegrin and metalloproteinase domain-containing protein 10-like isoform X3 [Centruroides sculpturatus]XP_023234713.1 disintegrin and metalloproteinase domain-containing protein 10-like isoform X4 [Centruroides sculpturatus]
MNSLVILLNIFVSFSLSVSLLNYKKLDQIEYYEIIDFKANFTEGETLENIKIKTAITVKFRAFKKKFELVLQEDNSIISPSAKVYMVADEIIKLYPKNIEGSSIYKGTVSGDKQSFVNGYLHRNGFIGKIQLKYETYFTENAFAYFKDETFKDKLIIYKDVDVKPVGCKSFERYRSCLNNRIIHQSLNTNLMNDKENGRSHLLRKSTVDEQNTLMCNIEVMADHTFVDHFNRDRGTVIAEMLYHVKVADKVFRNLDFNKEDAPKGIRINVEKITVIENPNNPTYYLNSYVDKATAYSELLAANSKQTWCMFIAFCHRDFQGKVGQAFTNGVCHGNTKGTSINVAFVSIIANERRVPKMEISKSLLHEMGHSFGSSHDPPNDPVCSPGDRRDYLGNYVMYGALISNYTDGSLYNNWKFSPCSKNQIYDNLFVDKGAFCMKKPKSICGNGITEQGEECDCGSPEYCEKLDPCCNPPGSRAPCTLLKQSQNFCSPREGDCCNEKCEFLAKEGQRQCFVYTPCREKILYCNGLSPFCPEVILPDGTSCSGPNICKSGSCLVDVCKNNGLQLCKCPKSLECQICCVDKEGTPCNNNSGMCLPNGTCYSKHISGNWWNTFWPYLLPVPLFMTLRHSMFLYRYSKMKLLNFKSERKNWQ